MNDSAKESPIPDDENAAVDGLLQEYARTGGPGDDEQLVKSVLARIESNEAEQQPASSVRASRGERDWPWLFGARFWKLTAAIMLVCGLSIGGNAWFISKAQADPTEVMLFTRPRFAPGDDAQLRVLVRDGRDQSPLANATVGVRLVSSDGSRQQIATATTGEDGIADISAELNQQLTDGEYTFEVEVAAATGRAAAQQTISVARSFRTMLSTDKPLYQPGQTIHMRALSLTTDSMTPTGGRTVHFQVRDGKGNKVFAASPQTSDFGIAAADFKLADQVNQGDYQIAVTVGDTTSERTVKVTRYVLPKFRVGLATDRSFYKPGELVTLTVDAEYTFGKPAASARVQIEALQTTPRRQPFQTITGTTDDAGQFTARVRLKDRFAGSTLNNGDAEVQFVARVTDRTGETNSRTLPRIVATNPIRIEVFPESGELVRGVENTLYIMTAAPDGTPVRTQITTGGGTKVETNEVGIAKVRLTPTGNAMKLSLTARNLATGTESRVEKQLRLGATNVLLRADRAVYRQGETVQLTVLSASRAGRAFVDIVREGRSLTTTAVDLIDGKGEYALDLPADILGTVQLQAYSISPSGRIARDTKVIQVRRADQLDVTVTLDAQEYGPAEQAMINFLVKSRAGDPVQASLSLAIVDEAVFALNDSRPGLEDMYFLVQEELLKPRYQFITQPDGRIFTREDQAPRPELEEARVVRFSAAEATDAEAPEHTQGETLARRQRQVKRTKKESRRGLLALMGGVPFTICCVLLAVFTIYAVSRVGHRAAQLPFEAITLFRVEMRLLFWITVAVTIAFPTLLYALGNVELMRETLPRSLTLLLMGAIGAATIAAPVVRLRRFAARHNFAPLFRRTVWLLPAAYFLIVCMIAGYTSAIDLDSRSVSDNRVLWQLFGGLLGFVIAIGFLGFLRTALTGEATWKHQLGSLGLHQAAVVIPFTAIVLAFVSQAGGNKSEAGRALGKIVGMDMATTDNAVIRPPEMDSPVKGDAQPGAGTEPRVRRYFPETLLWQPQLLTDESGKAQLEVNLADSITTWRLAGSAISKAGQMGSFEQGIRVFQDFFIDVRMPVKLTQGDEVTVPISVFNYLNEKQTIVLEAVPGDWFEFVDDEPAKSIEAAANEVLQSGYRIKVLRPGQHTLRVRARGTSLADAVERPVAVEPNGVRTEQVVNARLNKTATEAIAIPPSAIDGGSDLFVKIYPGGFSQVVEGMDSIFQMPHGCFEQTSSTTYPNVLVLNYLRETKQVNADVEMKALDFIATGYQRLLSFEVDGGGFDWFGRPPANEVLTAYGLHEFLDMAKVYDVDRDMIERTQQWLVTRMRPDGTWAGEDLRHERPNGEEADRRIVRQTAYITWALARTGDLRGLEKSIAFLKAQTAHEDAYVLALVANALIACGCDDQAREAVARLSDMAQQDSAPVFWTSADAGLTYGRGDSLAVETTALAVQAMVATRTHPNLVARAMEWLVSKRDARGTWHSTQATVQAMRALLIADNGRVTQDTVVSIAVNGQTAEPLTITEETGDVFHLISLREFVRDGDNEVTLSVDNDSLLAYQIVGVHYQPRSEQPQPEPKVLEIRTSYGEAEVSVNDLVTVGVMMRYHRRQNAPMTLVDLGIPPGFEIEPASFRRLMDTGVITKYEPKGPQVSLYFESIPGDGRPTTFEYQLRAKYPVKAQAPPSVAYQYYEPEIRDASAPVTLTISP